ncbi:tyrosine-type recombinase/integrase [Devosia psychrophila]|uniref:tyrosine-type recombinase/integrase n=1 Tax=Devosia psychrophila TaxID=728005 RepID=UPI00130DCF83|nr:tyrosine-type recombinase/integrase [Devosia psychrophila]
MKYVVRTPAGAFQYRRRVPKEVANVILKLEFKQLLGETERSALAAWPRYNAQVEREIADAQRSLTRAAGSGITTDREAYLAAMERVAALEAAATSADALDVAADSMMDRYRRDPETGDPVGANPIDTHTINLLRNRAGTYPAPEVTLEDAKRLYIAEKSKEAGWADDTRASGRVDRVIGMVAEALGRNPVVAGLTRDDARKVRDHMLARLKVNGEKIAAASVARELNDIKAVVSFAKKEMGLLGTFQNPFNDLSVGNGDQFMSDAEKRLPLPPDILKDVRSRVVAHSNPELALIWQILEGTGCRLAEIAGLRVQDIVLDGQLGAAFPHVKVMWHEDRRVKTRASLRHVPLVGAALDAARSALKLPREAHMVFQAYGRQRGSDTASAALMKHVRRVTQNRKHVVHSLRHNMKDNLDLAEVGALDRNLIMGWSLGGVGDRVYGGDTRALRVTTRAMKRAMGIPLTDADRGGADTHGDRH